MSALPGVGRPRHTENLNTCAVHTGDELMDAQHMVPPLRRHEGHWEEDIAEEERTKKSSSRLSSG